MSFYGHFFVFFFLPVLELHELSVNAYSCTRQRNAM